MNNVSSVVVELIDVCLTDSLSMQAIGDRLDELEGLDLADVERTLRSTLENAIHFLRHYQTDDDIRRRDREYADFQEAELREFRRLLSSR